jgi:pilus assembly protein CpaF
MLSRLSKREPESGSSAPGGESPREPTARTPSAEETDRREYAMFREVRDEVQETALAETEIDFTTADRDEVREILQGIFSTVLAKTRFRLSRNERIQLFEQVLDDLIGFGPLEELLADEATTDIMVAGHDRVFVERNGRVMQTKIEFDDEDHLLHIIERIVTPLGRRIDEASPMVDARLPDGSRVNCVVRPIAIDGPALTIRKFSKIPYTVGDLVAFGTGSPEMFEFLNYCVLADSNTLVAGGSSSGKTTLLNVLSQYIPEDDRIVTIENAAELQLLQPHVIRLESRPANIEGEGEITIRDLVINSLRMRPDRLVVGEVRSGEAIDLLQAMNTGRNGSMGTLHASSASDSLARLEVMCLMAGMDLPIKAIREQIASAVDVIVFMARMRDGSRKIVSVSEVSGMEGDKINVSNLFRWEQIGIDDDGAAIGRMQPTGVEPRRLHDRFEAAGMHLPPGMFTPRVSRVVSTPPAEESGDGSPAADDGVD